MGVIENRIDITELERSGGGGGGGTAASVSYDNTTSHMTATNVQAALDELNLDVVGDHAAIIATQETIAPVEDAATSSAAYAIGDYLIHNNSLMRVTAAIAIGDTLTVGTNITAATPVMKELTSGVENFTLTDFENQEKIQSVSWARLRKYGKIGIVDMAISFSESLLNTKLLSALTLGEYKAIGNQELSISVFNPDSGKFPSNLRSFFNNDGELTINADLTSYTIPSGGILFIITGSYIIQ